MRSVFCGAYTGKTLLAGYVVEGENECMDYKETILIVDDSALNRMVLIEILGKAYVSTELGDAFVFAVLIVVLLVKPAGLLGRQAQEKV